LNRRTEKGKKKGQREKERQKDREIKGKTDKRKREKDLR
jgi:hypothetical protein